MKAFLLLAVLVASITARSQNNIVFELKSIQLGKHTLELKENKFFPFKAAPLSSIQEIGALNGQEIGIQVEVLKTAFAGSGYISAVAFFKKSGNEWERLYLFGHEPIQLEDPEAKPVSGLGGYQVSLERDGVLDVKCAVHYYKNK